MCNAVWAAFAENLEQQVENNLRVIDDHILARLKPGAAPEDLYDRLIEDLWNTNAELRRLAARARARLTH
jgi:hypothetical protein